MQATEVLVDLLALRVAAKSSIPILLTDRILIIPPTARLVTLPSPKSPAATLILAALA